MKKNSLSSKGLSMSQAQSVSNICNQMATEIENQIKSFNNCKKVITIDGKEHLIQKSKPIPENISKLIEMQGKLYGVQAFLMENIKAKKDLLDDANEMEFEYSIPRPQQVVCDKIKTIPFVNEQWGWEQLSVAEMNEFYEYEALASSIGKFIHKKGKLDDLRAELNHLPEIEWIQLEKDKNTPVSIIAHHTSEELTKHYLELATKHREYEQRVNYFKAKVKNLVTEENARISKENSLIDARNAEIIDNHLKEWTEVINKWNEERNKILRNFEHEKELEIKRISALRIEIPERFKKLIDEILKDGNLEEK